MSATTTSKPAEMRQGSLEWRQARCGKITSSCFGKVMTQGRGKDNPWGQTAFTYMMEVLGEQLSGMPADEINSKYIEWGNTHEPTARALYTWRVGLPVTLTGFVPHPELPWVGGSPDGLVGADGAMEIKCPYTIKNHLETIFQNEIVDKDYQWQVQGNLWVTGRAWYDFVSFHPSLPEDLQLHVIRVHRDEDMIEELDERVRRFGDMLSHRLRKIREQVTKDDFFGEQADKQSGDQKEDGNESATNE